VTSVNSRVTVRRVSSDGPRTTDVPHSGQNFADAGSCAPHSVQAVPVAVGVPATT
jgi:hypothetical protein